MQVCLAITSTWLDKISIQTIEFTKAMKLLKKWKKNYHSVCEVRVPFNLLFHSHEWTKHHHRNILTKSLRSISAILLYTILSLHTMVRYCAIHMAALSNMLCSVDHRQDREKLGVMNLWWYMGIEKRLTMVKNITLKH